MDINIVVAPKYARRVLQKSCALAATRALAAEQSEVFQSLSIVIVGDRAMRDYNRHFHQVNSTTDVLSFSSPLREEYLGDIIILYETAKTNAKHAGWRVPAMSRQSARDTRCLAPARL